MMVLLNYLLSANFVSLRLNRIAGLIVVIHLTYTYNVATYQDSGWSSQQL